MTSDCPLAGSLDCPVISTVISPLLLLIISPSISPHNLSLDLALDLARQVIESSFLEDINGILTSGEVSNLYPPDELAPIRESVRQEVRNAGLPENNDSMYSFFIEKVRSKMHLSLCMSPVGENYRNYVRMFPALVSCTTINWFSEWPPDALKEVATRFLESVELPKELLDPVSTIFAQTQTSVIAESSSMLARLGRPNYVTPTNYLELVKGYCKVRGEER